MAIGQNKEDFVIKRSKKIISMRKFRFSAEFTK